MTMANESTNTSIREDDETNTDTIEFSLPELPHHDPLTPYERRRVEEGKADTEMRRQAAAAAPMGNLSVLDQYRASMRPQVPLNTGEDALFSVPPSINEQRITSLTTDEGELGYL